MQFPEIILPQILSAGKNYKKKGGVKMETQEVVVVSRYEFWKPFLEEQSQENTENLDNLKEKSIECIAFSNYGSSCAGQCGSTCG